MRQQAKNAPNSHCVVGMMFIVPFQTHKMLNVFYLKSKLTFTTDSFLIKVRGVKKVYGIFYFVCVHPQNTHHAGPADIKFISWLMTNTGEL